MWEKVQMTKIARTAPKGSLACRRWSLMSTPPYRKLAEMQKRLRTRLVVRPLEAMTQPELTLSPAAAKRRRIYRKVDCRHRGSGWVDLARLAFRQAHPKHIADLYAGSGIPVCAIYDSCLAAAIAGCPAVQSAH